MSARPWRSESVLGTFSTFGCQRQLLRPGRSQLCVPAGGLQLRRHYNLRRAQRVFIYPVLRRLRFSLRANSQQLTLVEASQRSYSQYFSIPEDNHIALEDGSNLCVEVGGEPQPAYSRPYGSEKDTQISGCSAGSSEQVRP